jgi:regulatory protein
VDDADRPPAIRRKPSYAERRERRAAVEDVAEVLDAAARFLETRPRSIAEVRRRLTTAGYRAPLVDAAIVRMGELGFLDDDAFARTWVESRDRARPRGEHALRQELRLKGIDTAIVAAILDERRAVAATEAPAGHDNYGADDLAAERLLRRKLAPILRENDPRKRRQRAYALLARSGFSPDVCSTATKRVLDDAATTARDADPGLDETDLTDG